MTDTLNSGWARFAHRAASTRGIWVLAGRSMVLAIALAGPNASFAQTLTHFQYLTARDGLAFDQVYTAFQDSQGFMWFGTHLGLSRWDGYEFENYLDDHRENRERVIALFEDRDGNLWVGSAGGLTRIDPKRKIIQPILLDEYPVSGLDSADERAEKPHTRKVRDLCGIYEAPSTPGIFWLSTLGGGLIRWDRTSDSMRVFVPDPRVSTTIPDRHVATPLEDRAGRFWVPTSSGLAHMDRTTGTFHRVTIEPLLAVLEDPEHDDLLWLAERHGISRYDHSTGTRELVVKYEPLGADSVGTFWLAMPGSAVWDSRSPGVLWTAALSVRGPYRFDTKSGEVEHYPPAMPDTRAASEEKRTWFDGKRPVGRTSCVTQDHAGVVWVCSFDHGVSLADPSHRDVSLIPTGVFVSAIAEGSAGRWWAGAWSGRSRDVMMIDRTNGNRRRWSVAIPDERYDSVLPTWIHSVMEDSRGSLWIGEVDWEASRGALHRMDPKRGTLESYRYDPDDPAGFPPGGILSLHEDSDGTIWAGTYGGGLIRLQPDTGTFSRFTHDPTNPSSLPSDWVWSMTGDTQGRLWLGGSGGTVCQLDRQSGECAVYVIPDNVSGKSWHASDSARGLPRESWGVIRSIVERPVEPGVLWLGALGGLWRLNATTGEISEPVSIGSVTDVPVVSLVADEVGAIWIGTWGDGVIRFDPDTRTARTMDTPTRSIELGAGMLTDRGEVVFGPAALSELWIFDPRRSRGNLTPPRVQITRLDVIRRMAEEGRGNPSLAGDEVRLHHADNSFTVGFVALHYSDPGKNQYTYRLEGWRDVWHPVSTARTASFGHVAPGEYVFHVNAANSDGVWNEEGASLRIVIVPPWWRTRLAYILYALLLVGGIVATDRFRRRRVRSEERRRAEIREAEIRAESAEVNARMAEEHARRLEDLDAAKSRFFANISHEFRTPLTVIMGPLREWSQRGPDPSERGKQHSSMMLRNAQRLLRLINQLLDLARVESGQRELSAQDGDLVGFLREQVRAFAPMAERKPVQLSFETTHEKILARFDPDAVEKIIANLLSNAIKFTDESGSVSVSLNASPTVEAIDIVIRVRDTGTGIPEEELETIFERFHQADSSARRRHQGTGIGLALCKELVELLRGTIEVESTVGVGSAFTVRFRLEKSTAAEPSHTPGSHDRDTRALETVVLAADVERPAFKRRKSGPCLGQEAFEASILIVEDNEDVRSYLREHLSRRYRVLEAEDADTGLVRARDESPDLVISDVMMPGMDGFELCRRLKSTSATGHVPVILLTARAEEEDRIYGLELGADDYLSKPFSTRELEVRVMNLLLSRRRLREQYSRELWVKSPEIVIQPDDEVFMEKVLGAMNRHLGDANFSTDVLADEVALSRRQVERKVKDITGDTPPEFLRKIRLERAADILRKAPGSISEVAYAVGFKSASHFTHAFKKTFGVTPSKFAKGDTSDDVGN